MFTPAYERYLVEHYGKLRPNEKRALRNWLKEVRKYWKSERSLGSGLLWFLYSGE